MTPDPDATTAPLEPDSAPAALSAHERRAVEAAVAGAAGLLLGRVLLGRAGGLATGLAALGVGLLGKCPPPRPKEDSPEPGTNGTNGGTSHAAAPPPLSPSPPPAEMEPLMRVRLQTSPIPPLDAVAALARAELAQAENFVPLPVAVNAPEAVPESVPETAANMFPFTEESAPPPVAVPEEEIVIAKAPEPAPEPEVEVEVEPEAAPEPESVLPSSPPPAAEIEDAGAFAEMPALFEPPIETAPAMPVPEVSYLTQPTPPPAEPLSLASLLRQAESELETTPRPVTAPVMPVSHTTPVPLRPPSLKTTPVIGLMDDLPVEFAELKEEQEPGPREDFLLVPDETTAAVPALEPVVAALNIPLTHAEREPSPFLIDKVADSAPPPIIDVPATEKLAAEDVSGFFDPPVTAAPATVPVPVLETAPAPKPESGPVSVTPEAAVSPDREPPPWTAPVIVGVKEPEWDDVPPFPEASSLLTAPVPLPVQIRPIRPVKTAPLAPLGPLPSSATAPVTPAAVAPATAPVAAPAPVTPDPVPAEPITPFAPTTPEDMAALLQEGAPPFPAAAAVAPWAVDPETPPFVPPPPVDEAAPVPPPPIPDPLSPPPRVPTGPVRPLPIEATAPVYPLPLSSAAAPPRVPTVPVRPLPIADDTTPVPAAVALPRLLTGPVRPLPIDDTAPVNLPPMPDTTALPRAATGPVEPPPAPAVEGHSFLLEPPASETSPAPEPVPYGPMPDPEEIWRQAAAELATFRTDPVPPPFPPPVPAPAGTAPFPLTPETSVAPPFPAAIPAPLPAVAGPPTTAVPAPGAPPVELPPWLKSISPAEGEPEEESAHKPFLPTIRLAVPQGPQPLAARRPPPHSEIPPLETAAVQPVTLPGYRAESWTTAVPVPDLPQTPGAIPAEAATGPQASPPPPLVPPIPQPVPAHPVAVAPAPVPLDFTAPVRPAPAPAADDKIYVELRKSRHPSAPEPYKKKTITPLRVGLVVMLAVAALCLAFKDTLVPWIREFWQQRIQGQLPPRQQAPAPAPRPTASENVPGDGSDVKVVPDPKDTRKPAAPPRAEKPAPAPPVRPSSTTPSPASTPPASVPPASTPPASVPPASTPPAASPPASTSPASTAVQPAPVATKPLPDSEPLPLPQPPPAAAPEIPTGPLPVNEAGAKELVSRLLYATATRQVRPWILDEAKVGPGVDTYFGAGKFVPVSSHVSELTRSEKIPGTNRMMWQFKVTTDTVEGGFPVLVEETPEGLRADWELLSQCRDMEFQKWMAKADAPPARFYTGLQRRHPFADMLPGKDPDKYLAFAISAPILGEPASFAFIPAGTPLATRAAKLYDFSTPLQAPVLELAHKNGHVEITAIVRENWRSPAKK